MARTVKVSKTLAGWVYLDDDNKVVEIKRPEDAPEGATTFRLRSLPVEYTLCMGLASGAKERTEAIGEALRAVVTDVRGLVDDDGNELKYTPDLFDGFPMEVVLALSNHMGAKRMAMDKDAAARRGNEPSGTSRGRKSSGGTATKGSRTALHATN